jgi:GxxExxY protein
VKGEEFEIDLLVGDDVIVKIQAVEKVLEFHKRQMLMYLQGARKPLGLLINFGERLLMTAFEGAPALKSSSLQCAEATKPKLCAATL